MAYLKGDDHGICIFEDPKVSGSSYGAALMLRNQKWATNGTIFQIQTWLTCCRTEWWPRSPLVWSSPAPAWQVQTAGACAKRSSADRESQRKSVKPGPWHWRRRMSTMSMNRFQQTSQTPATGHGHESSSSSWTLSQAPLYVMLVRNKTDTTFGEQAR